MKYAASVLAVLLVALLLQALPQQARPLPKSGAGDVAAGAPIGSSTGLFIVRGRARVIDGDTLAIDGRPIRLEGIDAPEIKQSCRSPAGRRWPAGRIAATTLDRWLRGTLVSCRIVGRGRYGRLLGRCAADKLNINDAMVRRGLAWAFVKYSRSYIAQEKLARASGVGVWAVNCETAWDYRAGRWRDVVGDAPAGCAIKGNITRNGRIYHMPWGPWYGRTRIEPAKGERWFCDERQALNAGWRPALVR